MKDLGKCFVAGLILATLFSLPFWLPAVADEVRRAVDKVMGPIHP